MKIVQTHPDRPLLPVYDDSRPPAIGSAFDLVETLHPSPAQGKPGRLAYSLHPVGSTREDSSMKKIVSVLTTVYVSGPPVETVYGRWDTILGYVLPVSAVRPETSE